MKDGYFIDENQMAMLRTMAEVMLESTGEQRVAGELLSGCLRIVERTPTQIEDEEDIAKRDAYWDEVADQYDRDRLANQPTMERWDAVWAADAVANRLFGSKP